MSLLLGIETFQKFAVVVVGGVGGGWWSKGILEFRFGPNLGLRLEAWTKLNKNIKPNLCVCVFVCVCVFLYLPPCVCFIFNFYFYAALKSQVVKKTGFWALPIWRC